ncbi:MAG: SH3 domain-containing protein [Limnothrix sp.]
MSISNFFQFIFGFILGVLLLVAGSVGAAYYFFNRMASAPPKPVFSETLPAPTTPESEEKTAVTEAEPVAAEEEEPEEEEETEAEELPAGAYEATVTWPQGLSLRSEPDADAGRIGGVDYNAQVIVLESSDDDVWDKIRLTDGTEAWVKAGNVKKVDE